ncbi:unnamed protein product, partial [Symbiodinium sp. KB8]
KCSGARGGHSLPPTPTMTQCSLALVVDEFSFCSVLRELDPSAAVAARIFADAFGDHLAACPAQELASRQGEGFGRSGHKAREADETQQAKQQDPKVRAGDGDIIRGWKDP